MSITSQYTENNTVLTLFVTGDFDYSLAQEFKLTYSNKEAQQIKNVTVDLSKTKTIDSSALGMILGMQKDLGLANDCIRLVNANEIITKVLKITNLNNRFNTE